MSDNLKSYIERRPILLNNNTVALIQIFTKYTHLEDVVFGIYNDLDIIEQYDLAAKEFIRQLEDRCCDYFIEALIRECRRVLKSKRNKK